VKDSGKRGGHKRTSVTAEVMREELGSVVGRSLEVQASSATKFEKVLSDQQSCNGWTS
jgi:hypothetical protein